MGTRSVIIASQATNKARKVMTSAKTWGELKVQSDVEDLLIGNVEAIVNPGSVTLNRDEAVLPDTDFKLYLVPTKNKAGSISEWDAQRIGQEIADAIKKASRISTEEEVKNLKECLIMEVEDFFNITLEDDCKECAEALVEASKF